jgi:1-acyl-sn-glycerol-3-phosphate acyltransferase
VAVANKRQRVPGRWQAAWGRRVAQVIAHVYLRTKVIGRAHVPAGPVILAANHLSFLDGPLVLGVAPRGVHFLIKESLAKGFGKILLWAGQIPIYGGAGREALAVALAELKRGRLVGIFPEGTRRTGHVEAIHPGVAWLAIHSGAPVVPVACLGTRLEGEGVNRLPTFRRRIAIVFGPPVDLAPARALGKGRAAIDAAIGIIGKALTTHVESAEHTTGIPLPKTGGTNPA